MTSIAQLMEEADVGGIEMHEFVRLIDRWKNERRLYSSMLAELRYMDEDQRKDFYADVNWLILFLNHIHRRVEGL